MSLGQAVGQVPSPAVSPQDAVTIIEQRRDLGLSELREVWKARELVAFFIWRDLKIRYRQTALGAAWAVLQPLFTMTIFTIFFGRLAKVPSDGIPYPVFCFAALVPWTFFANGVTKASNSLVSNAHLIKKVYMPRLIIPLSTICSGVVDRPTARRAGSPAGSFTKIRNVRSETMNSTNTRKRVRLIR